MTSLRLLPFALLLPLLAACSSTPVQLAPFPLPPNLTAPCPPLPVPPDPLIDPERLEWEVRAVLKYEECRARHWLLAEAAQGKR